MPVPVFISPETEKKLRKQDLFVAAVNHCVNQGLVPSAANIATASGMSEAQVINVNRNMDMKTYCDSFRPHVLEALAACFREAKEGNMQAMGHIKDIYGLAMDKNKPDVGVGGRHKWDDGD